MLDRYRSRIPVTLITVAVLGCASTNSSSGTARPPESGTPAPRVSSPYPTEEQLRPLWTPLLLMRDGMVYRVDKPVDMRLLREERDSAGYVAGYPILEAGSIGRNEDWLASFKTILAKPTNYPRSQSGSVIPLSEHIVRLWGEGDSITVTFGPELSSFGLKFSSGVQIRGRLEEDREAMRGLIQAALHPAK